MSLMYAAAPGIYAIAAAAIADYFGKKHYQVIGKLYIRKHELTRLKKDDICQQIQKIFKWGYLVH